MFSAIRLFLAGLNWLPWLLGIGALSGAAIVFNSYVHGKEEIAVQKVQMELQKAKQSAIIDRLTKELEIADLNAIAAKREAELLMSRTESRVDYVAKARKANPKLGEILDQKIPSNLIY